MYLPERITHLLVSILYRQVKYNLRLKLDVYSMGGRYDISYGSKKNRRERFPFFWIYIISWGNIFDDHRVRKKETVYLWSTCVRTGNRVKGSEFWSQFCYTVLLSVKWDPSCRRRVGNWEAVFCDMQLPLVRQLVNSAGWSSMPPGRANGPSVHLLPLH